MDIQEKIVQLVKEIVMRNVNADQPLLSNNLLSSIDMVELAVNIEEAFKIKIDATEITVESFDTIEKISDFISKRLNEKN
ncbi:MAG: phosphopantetheine-binding protein [Spirochaetia bacterium]|nr:phosphopantetheine-binding protein [Spirochaetia bacterium]